MSNVKLTLRPPPNVDFVHGYPGIPPGPDRPQAAVKGAIEVRTPPSGVKAQWVRIELRKVETLPGGGDSNKFYDYVGPSPVTLWTAPDEYNVLRTQDFPFSIRIPESIPPTIALENRAGIEYELVATVCTKGKKTFLRKRKNIVTKEIAPVIIDKHELHSTWPVYCQPETRQLAQDGVTLMVERSHTCYGPGDRISVVATLKSDNLHTVILRGFEMTLKESVICRAHTYGTTRKQAPMVKLGSVGENKVAINATLYGGTMHQAELMCQLPPNHTTTSINAARHIDVTYVLSVKALMGTGTHITMDLPVVISNWQRYVSQEAIRRIGPAPALSLVPPSTTVTSAISVEPLSPRPPQQQQQQQQQQLPPAANTLPSATSHVRSPISQINTLPMSNRPGTANSTIDEFGYGFTKSATHRPTTGDTKTKEEEAMGTYRSPTVNSVTPSTAPPARRQVSAKPANPTNRFTIMNAEPEAPEEVSGASGDHDRPPVTGRNASTAASSQQQQGPWLTAEQEKKAYEMAREKVDKVQGTAPAPLAPTPIQQPKPTVPSGSKQPWMSSAEEKALLYQKAQEDVANAHSQNGAVEAPTTTSSSSAGGGGGSKLTPAQLYQQAMAGVNANQNRNQPPPPHVSPLSGRSANRSNSTSAAPPKIPQFLTAEQEKEALKRYEEAKMAVERVHNPDASGPALVSYDSLYPKTSSSGSAARDLLPPSFEASVTPAASSGAAQHLSAAAEKAALATRMREMDAQVASGQYDNPPPPAFDSTRTTAPTAAATTTSPNTPEQYIAAAAEKEALRKKLEEKDAAAAAKRQRKAQARQQAAQRNGTAESRPAPTPPTNTGSSGKILTAAEEKALLQAKLDAKDAKKLNGGAQPKQVNAAPPTSLPSSSPPPASQQRQQGSTPSTPPPLMPRPPAEYIQETQEEDARVSKLAFGGSAKLEDGEEYGVSGLYVNGNGSVVKAPGPPPPLPPKPAGE